MMTHHTDHLPAQIHTGIVELQRLEQTGTDEPEFRRPRMIAKAQWHLARFISHHPTTTSTEGVLP
jgi:hypothetical protein